MSEYNYHGTNDEIDLRDIVIILIDGWKWIVGTAFLVLVAAVAFIAINVSNYETQFRAVPASSANFSGFNLFDGFSISSVEAYRLLGNRVSSFQNFENFFEENSDKFVLPEKYDLGKVFSNRLTVDGLYGNNDGGLVLKVRYSYPDSENGAEIINAYIRDTSKDVWKALRSRFDDYNQAQIASLSTSLELQRETLKTAREDRLFTLEQAIEVARQLDIKTPTTPQQFGRQPSGSEVIYASISGDGSLPLYFMGYQALEAEHNTLKNALEQDLSNGQIRATEEQLEKRLRIAELLSDGRLYGVDKGVEANFTERVVDVVEYAYPPAEPVGASRSLILILALILGGIVGTVVVFFVHFTRSLRSYRQQFV
ncbi:LPS O-antigen chain length determinant protein, WzzB/FepE family [Modicisalibacter ilicicola DSM 19980]|uniref:LPS O-antigen chain length determinant protein, WzzB/FepE family n=1 Tax=Modicisalibacter ilicicola DSM 19980 TaxID=1121942 RepID=A0A1M4TEQ9_9GAMM|nr:Wzz/FepE/Etk N-terminal domain-containing protein [Halomonas ilicicola]SHE42982.1 LPS O-antigen chain length determinant protein, WzzB/FepE family [Halomonas ilicicola DSM 19980]